MKPPIPPPDGWTPGEAAQALLPDLVEAAWGRRARFNRLGVDLLRVIQARDDLCLTGWDPTLPTSADRVRVDRRHYDAAIHMLDILEETLRICLPGREIRLAAVRIERIGPARQAHVAGQGRKPTQDEVNAWVMRCFQTARNGIPKATSVKADCRVAFQASHGRPATYAQIARAIKPVPEPMRRRAGARDR